MAKFIEVETYSNRIVINLDKVIYIKEDEGGSDSTIYFMNNHYEVRHRISDLKQRISLQSNFLSLHVFSDDGEKLEVLVNPDMVWAFEDEDNCVYVVFLDESDDFLEVEETLDEIKDQIVCL